MTDTPAIISNSLATHLRAASTVIWDFDGVIANTEPVQEQAFTEILRRMNIAPPADYFTDLIGMPEPDIWQDLVSKYEIALPVATLIDERSRYYLRRATELNLAPYVEPILEISDKVRAKSLIVSAGRYRHVDTLLRAWGIRDRFFSVLCTGSPHVPQPFSKPEQLKTVLENELPPVVIIEDSPKYLAIGGAAGAVTVGVSHELNSVSQAQGWDHILRSSAL
ncbi:HAD family hydrolase [Nocardia gipuzkoensis]